MNYEFPHIYTLADVLPAIAGRQEFVVAERPEHGFIVVNYLVNMEDTFPPVVTLNDAIRRECRGLIFDLEGDNKILARRYHKFMNVNERAETLVENVDMSQEHIILEKLDGSMITPIPLKDGIFWGTKMGVTEIGDQAHNFVRFGPISFYNSLAEECFRDGLTPIFEWCSRKQRIVIDYPEDQLVLTAMRNTITGEYQSYERMVEPCTVFGIPMVKALTGSISNMDKFIEETRELVDAEGYVIRFDDGHMLKIKADHYVQLHKAMDQMRFEKDIIQIIVTNKADDLKANLKQEDRDVLATFEADFWIHVEHIAETLKWIVIEAKDNTNESKKKFALEYVPQHDPVFKSLLFKIWDDKDPLETVVDAIANKTGTSTQVNSVRELFGGIIWSDYK